MVSDKKLAALEGAADAAMAKWTASRSPADLDAVMRANDAIIAHIRPALAKLSDPAPTRNSVKAGQLTFVGKAADSCRKLKGGRRG